MFWRFCLTSLTQLSREYRGLSKNLLRNLHEGSNVPIMSGRCAIGRTERNQGRWWGISGRSAKIRYRSLLVTAHHDDRIELPARGPMSAAWVRSCSPLALIHFISAISSGSVAPLRPLWAQTHSTPPALWTQHEEIASSLVWQWPLLPSWVLIMLLKFHRQMAL